MSAPSGPEVRVRCQLRWRDMDMLGHLNQAVYHELLEEGRAELLMELMRRLGGGLHGHTFVVVRVELDYRREVRKDHGEVEIVVRLAEVGTSSITLTHEVLRADGVVAAGGRTVLVAWDAVQRGKRELSSEERAALLDG